MSDSTASSLPSPCQEACARCILRAAQGEVPWSEDLYRSLSSFYNGLGIGSICCGLLGAVMVIGLNCPDEQLARQKTLRLLDKVQQKYGSLYCPRLKDPSDDCQALLEDIQQLTRETLREP